MKRKILSWIVGAVIVAGAVVGAYFIGKYSVSDTDAGILSELEKLRAEQSGVAVTKRVSQQMEDIAYQQKAVSDMERVRAENQSRLAISMRNKAEQESAFAKAAESKAVEAAAEAELQKSKALDLQKVAEEQRDEANLARSIADTLTFRILGRTLGTSSVTQFEGGNKSLASQLAYASWYFLNKYGGNTYQPETFDALSLSSNSRGTVQTKKGGSVTALAPLWDLGSIAVTDYGEIELHKKIGARRKILYQNSKYEFVGVWADTSVTYALSRRGPLCKLDKKLNLEEIQMPSGTYLSMSRLSDSTFLFVQKNALITMILPSGRVTAKTAVDGTISTVLCRDDEIDLYYEDGRSAVSDFSLSLVPSVSYAPKVVTAACFDKNLEAFFLGCKDGDVLLLDRNRRLLTTIFGHSSRVNGIVLSGSVAATCSYDKKLLLWNLPLLHLDSNKTLAQELGIPEERLSSSAHLSSNEWLSPASVSYSGWPLSLTCISNNEIIVGVSNGQVQILNISVDSMAKKIRNGIFTPMTPVDWNRYVGTTVPYVSF